MAQIEISDVTLYELDASQQLRRNIEAPTPEARVEGDAFDLVGWVISQTSPTEGVEVVHEDAVIQRVPISVTRPDVADAFPRITGAEQSGFRATVTVPSTSESDLVLRAVLQDDTRVPLGVIRARRRPRAEEPIHLRENQEQPGGLARFFRRFLGWEGK